MLPRYYRSTGAGGGREVHNRLVGMSGGGNLQLEQREGSGPGNLHSNSNSDLIDLKVQKGKTKTAIKRLLKQIQEVCLVNVQTVLNQSGPGNKLGVPSKEFASQTEPIEFGDSKWKPMKVIKTLLCAKAAHNAH